MCIRDRDDMGREQRSSVRKHQVQPDPQLRQLPRAANGVCGGRCADHQAGGGQDARPTCLLDRLIHRFM